MPLNIDSWIGGVIDKVSKTAWGAAAVFFFATTAIIGFEYASYVKDVREKYLTTTEADRLVAENNGYKAREQKRADDDHQRSVMLDSLLRDYNKIQYQLEVLKSNQNAIQKEVSNKTKIIQNETQ